MIHLAEAKVVAHDAADRLFTLAILARNISLGQALAILIEAVKLSTRSYLDPLKSRRAVLIVVEILLGERVSNELRKVKRWAFARFRLNCGRKSELEHTDVFPLVF